MYGSSIINIMLITERKRRSFLYNIPYGENELVWLEENFFPIATTSLLTKDSFREKNRERKKMKSLRTYLSRNGGKYDGKRKSSQKLQTYKEVRGVVC